MPIVATQQYILTLLDGLQWPISNLPPLQAQITPPDPNVDAQIPQAYIWPGRGDESRDPRKGGTINRAAFQGAPSGLKVLDHRVDVYLVWWMDNDDPDSDNLFPGMVDTIMEALRVSPNPSPIQTDPYSGMQSYLIDVGESISYQFTLRSVVDERYDRYDSLLTLAINEVFPS